MLRGTRSSSAAKVETNTIALKIYIRYHYHHYFVAERDTTYNNYDGS